MGNGGAKVFGDMLRGNKTLQTLDVSNNGFGSVQVGDQVKLKNGSIKRVIKFPGNPNYLQLEGDSDSVEYGEANYSLVDIGIPSLCAGVAASQSLLTVSDFLTSARFFDSHRPFLLLVRSSMHLGTRSLRTSSEPSCTPTRTSATLEAP
jgi:hypothetical protein